MDVIEILSESNLFEICLKLMIKFPLNNLMHLYVERIIISAINLSVKI